jgi:hypothetical protein
MAILLNLEDGSPLSKWVELTAVRRRLLRPGWLLRSKHSVWYRTLLGRRRCKRVLILSCTRGGRCYQCMWGRTERTGGG